MIKKLAIIFISLLVVGLLAAAMIVYWSELRGAGPAVLAPAYDISDRLDRTDPEPIEEPSSTEILYTTQGPLTLPVGMRIDVYAENLGDPREMEFSPSGDLLVSVPDEGKIVRLIDSDNDGIAESVVSVAAGLNKPHGFTFNCAAEPCQMYIGQQDGVSIYDWDAGTHTAINGRDIISLPGGGRHWRKQLLIAPHEGQQKLFVKVASSCDTCYEEDARRGTIMIMNLDGSNAEIFATGLRNAAFMALHPVTGEIWVTEMGRDHLGNNLPPDEINVVRQGGDYGWPICYGQNVHDTVFDTNTYIQDPCTDKVPSHIDIPAHSSPLGLGFIPEEGWPEDWWYDLVVAYHGSWNRTPPTGYKLVKYMLDEEGNFLGVDDFISGWLDGSVSSGRPADVLITPGGIMYVSDDKAGVVYRVTRTQQ
ncbi:MAG: PQQ-dependent sugar dehydrogenase [Patescibacteria group bacterium]